jgi:hypothetical protein
MRPAICALSSLLLVGGCYNPDLSGPGGFLCATNGCPSGFVCQSGVCVRSGQSRPDGGRPSEVRPSEARPPGTLACTVTPGGVAIDPNRVGDGFDFERSNGGTLAVSYTQNLVGHDLRLAKRPPGTAVAWTSRELLQNVGESTAVAFDEVGAACAANATLVAYRTAPQAGTLRVICDGCPGAGTPPPFDIDPTPGAGGHVDIATQAPGQCGVWLAYQGGGAAHLRRARLDPAASQKVKVEDVPVDAKAPALFIAQDWDSSNHAITYIADRSVWQARLEGTPGALWTTRKIDGAADLPDHHGLAQVGSNLVYAAGAVASPVVRYWVHDQASDVHAGSRPSLAYNGTAEAVAYIDGADGWVLARTGDAKWGTPAARLDGARRILVRAGDGPEAWEVVYRTETELRHATVICK